MHSLGLTELQCGLEEGIHPLEAPSLSRNRKPSYYRHAQEAGHNRLLQKDMWTKLSRMRRGKMPEEKKQSWHVQRPCARVGRMPAVEGSEVQLDVEEEKWPPKTELVFMIQQKAK